MPSEYISVCLFVAAVDCEGFCVQPQVGRGVDLCGAQAIIG